MHLFFALFSIWKRLPWLFGLLDNQGKKQTYLTLVNATLTMQLKSDLLLTLLLIIEQIFMSSKPLFLTRPTHKKSFL